MPLRLFSPAHARAARDSFEAKMSKRGSRGR